MGHTVAKWAGEGNDWMELVAQHRLRQEGVVHWGRGPGLVGPRRRRNPGNCLPSGLGNR